MIDNKTDGDEKPSEPAPADKTGAVDSERAPQRGKLGIRKSPEASAGQGPPGGSPERTRPRLRSRFNGGLKPAQRGARVGSTASPDARPPTPPGRGGGRSPGDEKGRASSSDRRASGSAWASADPARKPPATAERGRKGESGGRAEGRDRPVRTVGKANARNEPRSDWGERGRPVPAGDGRGASKPEPPVVGLPVQVQAGAHAPQSDGVRLSKIMAERGLCSRREADQIIERGWVSVDGRRVSQLGIRISPDAVVELAPEATARQAAQVTILLHKPVGYVSGQPEPEHVPAVTLIDAQSQFDRDVSQRFHPDHLRGLAPAGRLDIDSTGLLVLTQNGRVARQLIGDDSKVEKEYLVRVEGRLDEQGLALLNHGLELDGRKLRPAKVEWVNEDQLRFVLREGRKRQIRRMCELVGLNVVGLKRVRIGRVRLGDLPLGQWRFLREDEQFS